MSTFCSRLATRLIRNLEDRKGFDDLLYDIDDMVKADITDEMAEAIAAALAERLEIE